VTPAAKPCFASSPSSGQDAASGDVSGKASDTAPEKGQSNGGGDSGFCISTRAMKLMHAVLKPGVKSSLSWWQRRHQLLLLSPCAMLKGPPRLLHRTPQCSRARVVLQVLLELQFLRPGVLQRPLLVSLRTLLGRRNVRSRRRHPATRQERGPRGTCGDSSGARCCRRNFRS